ncbi:MAG: ATP-binding protein, partial [Eubacteriales bacterium]|nr:ATP-binding protein [Eubacteriales bacterium]
LSHYGEENLVEYISTLSYKNDLYIHIESGDGTIIFSPTQNLDRPRLPAGRIYLMDMAVMKENLINSSKQSVSSILTDRGHNNTLAYGAWLDRTAGQEVILYIFSPLFPVASTVDILSNQLKYVTVISLILAFGLSLLISNRISRPIVNITKSANKLAEGNYEVTFEGGHYAEIAQLADTLNDTSRKLAKADNLQKDLIANVSHDLRTPLTMVKSYAEMIRDLSGDNPEKRNAHLQVIIDEADRLNLLVGDLLILSKMQSGAGALNHTKFCLKDSIMSILNSYRLLSEQEGYQFICHCDPALIVSGDEARIKQVLSNLVNNAVRYSDENKTITITAAEAGNAVRCEVTDQGQGIPEDELEHIWERYYKSSSNHSRNTSGTGLGLSIVREILILHKARFGVISKLHEGSTFWFELDK